MSWQSVSPLWYHEEQATTCLQQDRNSAGLWRKWPRGSEFIQSSWLSIGPNFSASRWPLEAVLLLTSDLPAPGEGPQWLSSRSRASQPPSSDVDCLLSTVGGATAAPGRWGGEGPTPAEAFFDAAASWYGMVALLCRSALTKHWLPRMWSTPRTNGWPRYGSGKRGSSPSPPTSSSVMALMPSLLR